MLPGGSHSGMGMGLMAGLDSLASDKGRGLSMAWATGLPLGGEAPLLTGGIALSGCQGLR